MRSVGYSFDAAVADIVDNSIAAGARHVQIVADSVDASYIAFLDDGSGMTSDEAREALKLAGTSRIERSSTDLGRFGLGLKTASLSQCRRLSVVTVRGGVLTGLQWDIDHVLQTGSWSIRVLDAQDLSVIPQADRLSLDTNATLVVWQTLDYLLAGAGDPALEISERLQHLRHHLGLVFQRFLEGRGSVRVEVNGVAVAPVDPFLESNSKTQAGPRETVVIEGHTVDVDPFTLPHPSALSARDRKRSDLGSSMRDHQGFYVYRNKRLISHGGWFGLAKLDELTKQSRVRVDIPPELDQQWQLDIKKSRVEPPQAFRSRFRQIIEHVTGGSKRLHRFRGRASARSDAVYLWQAIEERGGYRYAINREHPMISGLEAQLPPEKRKLLDQTLNDLANYFPAPDLYVRMADSQPRIEVDSTESELRDRLRAIRDAGGSLADPAALVPALRRVEPFNNVVDLQSLVAQVWEENT
ncbi:ATP-binding protein [uncultured Microbacterium sp.]|uniref:DNA mismatch repair enzyme (Predicted ATPase) n=1 Tax=uncultured Microbacterium sp. TaxID=191216 RepID=A0A1Y5NU80_9MICO|nr:ATP-binding protein [uncultured Microbacterium sp.]SBS69936.1 DNA mismatch repair enzyme (Predicted ATPase) [uncultured Microbacterium sp.]